MEEPEKIEKPDKKADPPRMGKFGYASAGNTLPEGAKAPKKHPELESDWQTAMTGFFGPKERYSTDPNLAHYEEAVSKGLSAREARDFLSDFGISDKQIEEKLDERRTPDEPFFAFPKDMLREAEENRRFMGDVKSVSGVYGGAFGERELPSNKDSIFRDVAERLKGKGIRLQYMKPTGPWSRKGDNWVREAICKANGRTFKIKVIGNRELTRFRLSVAF